MLLAFIPLANLLGHETQRIRVWLGAAVFLGAPHSSKSTIKIKEWKTTIGLWQARWSASKKAF